VRNRYHDEESLTGVQLPSTPPKIKPIGGNNMGKKKVVKFSAGMCPKCGSKNLDYDGPDFNASSVMFHFECKDCLTVGYEESSLSFLGSYITEEDIFVEDGEEIKVNANEEN
jgi:hypothetical protein